MRLFAIPVLCLALLPAAAASQAVQRGKYFAFEEFGFEMWIPWGFHRSTSGEKRIYSFSGNTEGGRTLTFHEASMTSLDLYVGDRKRYLVEKCSGCEYEVHTDVKAGPVDAVIIVAKKLDAVEKLKDTDLITATMEIGDENIVELTMYLEKGKTERGLEQVRWMLSTFKFAGNPGLDDFCLERRIHKESGLSFRPPRGFKPEKPKDPGRMAFAGENRDAGIRLELKKSGATRLRGALDEEVGDYKRSARRSILFPHPGGCKLLGAFYASGDGSRSRTIIAAELEGGHFFTLRTDGASDRQESLVRTAELVAMSLGYLDMEKARREIKAAVEGLEEVLEKRQQDEIRARVEVLVPYPFMDAARTALADCLLDVRDARLQLEVIKALGSVKGGNVLPQLLRAVHVFKSRKQPDHVEAVLKALAVVQGSRALPVLKKLVMRGTNGQSAAAVRTLGHYGFERKRVLKDLVNLMAREEKAGRKPKVANRERWLVMKPAFQAGLKTLTGENFGTAAEARAWMKRK